MVRREAPTSERSRPRRRGFAAAVSAAAALAAAGCGDEGGAAERPRLVVSAASSLTEPLRACSERFAAADVRLSFAGSDELAAQIRRGVKPDVFAAANTELPEALAREGLLERPRVFATNELVLAVPNDGAVRTLEDAARPGHDVVVGSESVPVGAYTRKALARLPDEVERGILRNVRSEEPDVRGVVGKLARGAADAGFVYRSDAKSSDVEAIALPASAQPQVAYGAGVVRGAKQPELARRYVAGLESGPCADALRAARFGGPPGR
jgi:molybdate transport system substrate-binding protein